MNKKGSIYKRILELILNDDWHSLLLYLPPEEIEENRIATSLRDYEYEGDYQVDARYTFPNRTVLVKEVIKKVLGIKGK